MAGLVAALRVVRAAARGFDPALLSGAECAALVRDVAAAEKVLAGVRARAALRATDSGVHRVEGERRPEDWLAKQSGRSTQDAKDDLAAAAGMDRCPATKQAVEAGELSLAQAKETSSDPASEAELLATARTGNLARLKDQARQMRLAKLDPEDLYRRQRQARQFRHWRDEMGMVRLHGALPPEVGVPFVNRLDADTDRLHRAAKQRGETERRDAHAADAFVAMTQGQGKGHHRKADMVIVVDARVYAGGDQAEGPCHILDGGPIPARVARSFAEDAFLKIVLHDGIDIQRVAHVGRYRPAELDTALNLGPPPLFNGIRCVDCGRQHYLEWDHVDPVANGGLTTYDNENPRCWPCHLAKTERDRAQGLLGPRARAPANAGGG